MHNWILEWGIDELFLDENNMISDEVDVVHGVSSNDS
jgi:hypothetical protein